MSNVIEKPITWICRFHPTNSFHEVGCPHQEWTKEELQRALELAKESLIQTVEVLAGWDKN
jgi:hypothetical protein